MQRTHKHTATALTHNFCSLLSRGNQCAFIRGKLYSKSGARRTKEKELHAQKTGKLFHSIFFFATFAFVFFYSLFADDVLTCSTTIIHFFFVLRLATGKSFTFSLLALFFFLFCFSVHFACSWHFFFLFFSLVFRTKL